MAAVQTIIFKFSLSVITVIICCGVRVSGAVSAVSIGGTKDSPVSFICTGSPGIAPQWYDCGTDSTCAASKVIQAATGIAVVDSTNGSLTISSVQFSDEKFYSCKRNNVEMNRYRLYVMTKPQCSGKSNLANGEKSILTCSVEYKLSSTAPKVVWQDGLSRKRRRRDATQSSVTLTTEITGSWDTDNTKQVCIAKLYGHTDQCFVTISATYPVTNVELMPRMSVIDAGQDVTCSANANPRPTIKMVVEVNGETLESVTPTWRMMSKWAGHKVTVTCRASNTIDGQQSEDNDSKEYDVKASNYTDPIPPPTEKSTADVETTENSTASSADFKQKLEGQRGDVSTASAKGAIIAVVIIVIVAALILLAAFIVLRKRNQQSRSASYAPNGPANNSQEADTSLLPANNKEQAA